MDAKECITSPLLIFMNTNQICSHVNEMSTIAVVEDCRIYLNCTQCKHTSVFETVSSGLCTTHSVNNNFKHLLMTSFIIIITNVYICTNAYMKKYIQIAKFFFVSIFVL